MTTILCGVLSLHSWLCSSYLSISLAKSGSILLEFDYDGLRRYPTITPQPSVDYDTSMVGNYIKVIGVDTI